MHHIYCFCNESNFAIFGSLLFSFGFGGDWVLAMITLPTFTDALRDKRARKRLACPWTSECRIHVFCPMELVCFGKYRTRSTSCNGCCRTSCKRKDFIKGTHFSQQSLINNTAGVEVPLSGRIHTPQKVVDESPCVLTLLHVCIQSNLKRRET